MNNFKINHYFENLIAENIIKIGFYYQNINLYFPEQTLKYIFEIDYSGNSLIEYINTYFHNNNSVYHNTSSSISNDKVIINFDKDYVKYINDNINKFDFLHSFIELFNHHHDINIDNIVNLFKSYSNDIIFSSINSDEFDYYIYFNNDFPDFFVYCIKDNYGHYEYHRFIKDDFFNNIIKNIN